MMFKTVTFRNYYSLSAKMLALICSLVFQMTFPAKALADINDDIDELSVNVNVKGIGSAEVPALYYDEELYLSVIDVFRFLKIKSTYNETLDSVAGYLLNEDATYLISKQRNVIVYQGKVQPLMQHDLIRYDGRLYLKRTYFGSVFGLQCNFNFRNLSVVLDTDVDLPVIKEMRQELMRANVSKLQGEMVADTTIERNFPAAGLSMADWLVINSHDLEGNHDLRLGLGLGGVLLGGETNVNLNYYSASDLEPRQQFYQWRHVRNDRKALRQVILGKVQPQFVSSVYAPAIGFQLTNTATTFKRSFGSYTISNTTNPGWIVELYVNNVLVNYVKADASGFYTFQVPLVYGNSVVKLRFYGPYGEERAAEEYINIPFNFMPSGKFEYNFSGGIIEDGFHSFNVQSVYGDSVVNTRIEGQKNSMFSRARVDYGLNPYITIGGGAEYLSSVSAGTAMPFISASIRLTPLLLLTTDYTDKVLSKSVLTYSLPSGWQFEVNYLNYDKNQEAIRFDYLEQRKAMVSFPVRTKWLTAYSRIAFNQIVLENTDYMTTEWLLSGALRKVNYNISSYALLVKEADPFIYSNFSFSFHPVKKIIITPQLQYEYTKSNIVSMRCLVEKTLKGFGVVNAYYEENVQSNIRTVGVGLRMDLSFAQVGFLAIRGNRTTDFTETANGGIVYNSGLNHLNVSNRNSLGKGGITLIPFVDLDGNGIKGDDEPKAEGLKVSINGGRMMYVEKDTAIQIFELEPYTAYHVKLQPSSFDNIAWTVKNKVIKVIVDPNSMKPVFVPVDVSAEASGQVMLEENAALRGLGKITVRIYDTQMQLVGKTLTESDGYFSFSGLKPGTYRVQLDPLQLTKLELYSTPDQLPVTVKKLTDGDYIDGLIFKVRKKNPVVETH